MLENFCLFAAKTERSISGRRRRCRCRWKIPVGRSPSREGRRERRVNWLAWLQFQGPPFLLHQIGFRVLENYGLGLGLL